MVHSTQLECSCASNSSLKPACVPLFLLNNLLVCLYFLLTTCLCASLNSFQQPDCVLLSFSMTTCLCAFPDLSQQPPAHVPLSFSCTTSLRDCLLFYNDLLVSLSSFPYKLVCVMCVCVCVCVLFTQGWQRPQRESTNGTTRLRPS